MAKPPSSREGYVEQAVKTFKVIGSPAYPMDEPRFRELVGRAYDRSFHPPGVARQLHAINCSGDRTRGLRRLDLPGAGHPRHRATRWCGPAAGKATARAIPGARLHMIEGMGHDLPPELHGGSPTRSTPTPARACRRARLSSSTPSPPRGASSSAR